MEKIAINPRRLYEGCLLAALAHAVAVSEYPEFNYEHSWNTINYCMNNSQGCRGTITFHEKYIVAAFRNESKVDSCKDTASYFEGAASEIVKVANIETLQYLLEEVNGRTKPLITAALWGDWEQLYSSQSLEVLFENGGYVIENQILNYWCALERWDDYYGFCDGQLQLIDSLYHRKLESGIDKQIILSENEIQQLYGDIDECKISLGELNILVV